MPTLIWIQPPVTPPPPRHMTNRDHVTLIVSMWGRLRAACHQRACKGLLAEAPLHAGLFGGVGGGSPGQGQHRDQITQAKTRPPALQ